MRPRAARDGDEPAAAFLTAVADPARAPIAAPVAVVVAHPDDETIGCGAQLPRFSDLTLVHVTDGAPTDLADAHRHGFAGAAEYAAARRRELEAAMALVGVPRAALTGLGVIDQHAALQLQEIARRLCAVLRRVDIVLTHPYEGGHPDHDAVAFAVHAARDLLARDGRRVAVVEMAFYHAGPSGWVRQRFVQTPGCVEVSVPLSPDERQLKRRMLEAHATQGATLADMADDVERFRRAPAYDFTALPNDGQLLYERHGWGMTGARWQALVRAALAGLGLEHAA